MRIDEKENTKLERSAHNIIYELQAPIYAQSTTLKYVLDDFKNKNELQNFELIELSLNSCNYTKDLVESYLLFQKIQQETFKPNYDRFNLSKLLNEIKYGFIALSKHYELNFEFSAKNETELRADKFYFTLAIENLLFFAIQNAGKNTSLKIRLREKRGEIQFSIKMQNPNVQFQNCGEFFKFYDFKKFCALSENQNSSGAKLSTCLMVSIAKEIIHAHFGRFSFQNLANNVNVLSFEMPV